jgi:predicted ABC-type transport system involved in lysophospholipase L1 biosynthesis ATPase subunit
MHIADGFLAAPLAGGLAAGGAAPVARRAQTALDESRVPPMGAAGAFVCAAQMIDFPVGASLDRPPAHLSKGEKQRVALAGILACRPEILAPDEPTGRSKR